MRWALTLVLVVTGCRDDVTSNDAASDAGDAIRAPAPPVLTPCPPGWREMDDACEPWPATGRSDTCDPGSAHLAGTPGCVSLSAACPLDDWPADLPADRPVVFVDDDAADGGDGRTRATAWRTIGGALASSPPDAVVAVAAGRYDDPGIVITDAREVRGACTARTILTASAPGNAAVELTGGGASLRDVLIQSPERIGVLVRAAGVHVEGVAIVGARGVGLGVRYGDVTMRRVQISDMRAPDAGLSVERGVDVEGASATLEQVRIDRARGVGVFVGGAATSLAAFDVAISRTQPIDDGTLGRGVELLAGAHAELERVVVEDVLDMGITASDAATTLSLADVVIRRVASEPLSGDYGRGLDVEAGASVSARRVAIDAATEAGVLASGVGTSLTLGDALVRDTASRRDGRRGRGVDASEGAAVSLRRVSILASREMGIFATAGATLTIEDLVLDGVVSRPADGTLGAGIWSQGGASVTVSRARVSGTQLSGVASIDHGAVVLADVSVRDVSPSACASACPDIAGGHALTSHFGSTLRASRFEVGGVALCGVLVGEPHPDGTATQMDLAEGTVADAPIGACVQEDGFDSARLHDRVRFVDVGVPLQATRYALPTAD